MELLFPPTSIPDGVDPKLKAEVFGGVGGSFQMGGLRQTLLFSFGGTTVCGS